MKKTLGILVSVALTAYLVVSLFLFTSPSPENLCEGIDVRVADSLDYGFINDDVVAGWLEKSGMNPVGHNMQEIDLDTMEHCLEEYPLVVSAECYRTSDRIRIKIRSCVPLLRVMSDDGADYFVDSYGRTLKKGNCIVNVPVVTGKVTRGLACGKLLDVVKTIDGDEFWKSQVSQINVNEKGQIELVPRVGNHVICLGTPDNLEEKLARVYAFYSKGLSKIGWNKYSYLNAAFDGQVICKKRNNGI